MAQHEQPIVPLWMEAKARKQVDILKEVARAIDESDRVRAGQPIANMTEADLETEQLRLQDLLRTRTLTVDGFQRLREIDFYLDGMRARRQYGPPQAEWTPERSGDE
jgi:hypothetical protein